MSPSLLEPARAAQSAAPEHAFVLPSAAVGHLAHMLETPPELRGDYKEIDVLNVDAVVLHGVFTAAELKKILATMKAQGKPT